jgi:ERCC4-type nuclease
MLNSFSNNLEVLAKLWYFKSHNSSCSNVILHNFDVDHHPFFSCLAHVKKILVACLIDGLIHCSAIGVNGPNQGFKIVWKCGLEGTCGKLEALAREKEDKHDND